MASDNRPPVHVMERVPGTLTHYDSNRLFKGPRLKKAEDRLLSDAPECANTEEDPAWIRNRAIEPEGLPLSNQHSAASLNLSSIKTFDDNSRYSLEHLPENEHLGKAPVVPLNTIQSPRELEPEPRDYRVEEARNHQTELERLNAAAQINAQRNRRDEQEAGCCCGLW